MYPPLNPRALKRCLSMNILDSWKNESTKSVYFMIKNKTAKLLFDVFNYSKLNLHGKEIINKFIDDGYNNCMEQLLTPLRSN